MSELFDTQRIAELGDAILRWLAANVFVLDNAAQLAIVLVALGVAVLASRWLPKSLPQPVQLAPLATLLHALRPLAQTLIWLVLTWLALLVARAAHRPSHLIDIAASLLTAWIAIRILSLAAPSARWARLMTWCRVVRRRVQHPGSARPHDHDARLRGARDAAVARVDLFRDQARRWCSPCCSRWRAPSRGLSARGSRTSRTLSASAQVLFTKSVRATLRRHRRGHRHPHARHPISTAIAVVLSALGLGAGFGLQKVISNIVSGVVLLLDQSIRPGDVISVSGTYGWVTALGGRDVSVRARATASST